MLLAELLERGVQEVGLLFRAHGLNIGVQDLQTHGDRATRVDGSHRILEKRPKVGEKVFAGLGCC